MQDLFGRPQLPQAGQDSGAAYLFIALHDYPLLSNCMIVLSIKVAMRGGRAEGEGGGDDTGTLLHCWEDISKLAPKHIIICDSAVAAERGRAAGCDKKHHAHYRDGRSRTPWWDCLAQGHGNGEVTNAPGKLRAVVVGGVCPLPSTSTNTEGQLQSIDKNDAIAN